MGGAVSGASGKQRRKGFYAEGAEAQRRTERRMKTKKKVVDEEDEATLAAIDEGIREAKAGRTIAAKQVRKLLREWTSGAARAKRR